MIKSKMLELKIRSKLHAYRWWYTRSACTEPFYNYALNEVGTLGNYGGENLDTSVVSCKRGIDLGVKPTFLVL